MGTSSARRGPTTGLWRAAKGAATRHLSPGAGGEVSAREVVARYLAALEETSGQGEALAAFRFTRKAGQDLGAFGQEVETRGWDAALEGTGLAPVAGGAAEMLAVGVAGVLAGNGGGLEEAVVRTALALAIREARQSRGRPEAAKLVRQFLATAVHLRLALDLGEPLEAAAGSFGRFRDGLGRIKALIEAGAAAAGGAAEGPATAGDWQGLMGWTWVTEVMAGLLARLREGDPRGRHYGSAG
ncbi:MAG: hypothetical protein ACLP2P_09280 [Desulfobaccales bacterium]